MTASGFDFALVVGFIIGVGVFSVLRMRSVLGSEWRVDAHGAHARPLHFRLRGNFTPWLADLMIRT